MITDMPKINKDHLRIIVTDSGLGGLSVQAKLNKELTTRKIARKVELIYFNSFAGDGLGYNEVSDFKEKLKIFNSALSRMAKFKPDIILVACNTLSAIYPFTKAADENKIPTIGIIDIGVDQILRSIKNSVNSSIILLGTETTVNSQVYQNKLIQNGIKANKIIAQGCKYLEDEIQIDSKSEKVKLLIEKYLTIAFNNIQLEKEEEIILVLGCTHYGYSTDIFNTVMKNKFKNNIKIINPNDGMVESVANLKSTKTDEITIINKVFSRVKLKEYQIEKLGQLLNKDSEDLTKALKDYEYKPNLFNLDK